MVRFSADFNLFLHRMPAGSLLGEVPNTLKGEDWRLRVTDTGPPARSCTSNGGPVFSSVDQQTSTEKTE